MSAFGFMAPIWLTVALFSELRAAVKVEGLVPGVWGKESKASGMGWGLGFRLSLNPICR